MAVPDVISQLAAMAADLETALAPDTDQRELQLLCEATTTAMRARGASVAVLDEDAGELRWVAANGPGADGILGQVLPLGHGLAGFVAATGQSLAVDDVSKDPRFAREVAERIGYIPGSMLVVPVLGDDGAVLGALSVLDRSGREDDLTVAAAFAAVAAAIVPGPAAMRNLGQLMLDTIAAAAEEEGASDVAATLRRRAARVPNADAELARVAALLVDLRRLGGKAPATALDLVESFTAYARAQRRR